LILPNFPVIAFRQPQLQKHLWAHACVPNIGISSEGFKRSQLIYLGLVAVGE